MWTTAYLLYNSLRDSRIGLAALLRPVISKESFVKCLIILQADYQRFIFR